MKNNAILSLNQLFKHAVSKYWARFIRYKLVQLNRCNDSQCEMICRDRALSGTFQRI